jgi:hypothetical protein
MHLLCLLHLLHLLHLLQQSGATSNEWCAGGRQTSNGEACLSARD